MVWEGPVPHFSRQELQCPGIGTIRLDMHFAVALPALRHEWGAPLLATSVCRSTAYNKKIGGHPRSLHLMHNPAHPTCGTMAADIAWRGWDAEQKLALARLAWSMGWSLGLHDGFLHIDRRADLAIDHLPQHLFVYGRWSEPFDDAAIRR